MSPEPTDLVRSVEPRRVRKVHEGGAQPWKVPRQRRPAEQSDVRRGVPVPRRKPHEPGEKVPTLELGPTTETMQEGICKGQTALFLTWKCFRREIKEFFINSLSVESFVIFSRGIFSAALLDTETSSCLRTGFCARPENLSSHKSFSFERKRFPSRFFYSRTLANPRRSFVH